MYQENIEGVQQTHEDPLRSIYISGEGKDS